jgi:hypothetical protein
VNGEGGGSGGEVSSPGTPSGPPRPVGPPRPSGAPVPRPGGGVGGVNGEGGGSGGEVSSPGTPSGAPRPVGPPRPSGAPVQRSSVSSDPLSTDALPRPPVRPVLPSSEPVPADPMPAVVKPDSAAPSAAKLTPASSARVAEKPTLSGVAAPQVSANRTPLMSPAAPLPVAPAQVLMTPYGPVALAAPGQPYAMMMPMPAMIDPRTGWPIPTALPGMMMPPGAMLQSQGVSRGSRGNPIMKGDATDDFVAGSRFGGVGSGGPASVLTAAQGVVSDVESEIPRADEASSDDDRLTSISRRRSARHRSSNRRGHRDKSRSRSRRSRSRSRGQYESEDETDEVSDSMFDSPPRDTAKPAPRKEIKDAHVAAEATKSSVASPQSGSSLACPGQTRIDVV